MISSLNPMQSRTVGWACIAAMTIGLAGCDLTVPETLDCLDVPAGMAVYFPIEQGTEWSFSYDRKRTTSSFGTEAGTHYHEWVGLLDWRIESVTCSSTDIDFALSAEFEGKLVHTWVSPGGDTLRVDEEPVTWTRTEEAMVRSHDLHIPKYVHLPEYNAAIPAENRRVELQWLYADQSPDTIEGYKGQPLGTVGSRIDNTARLLRGSGLTHWHLGLTWGGPSPGSDEVTIQLLE